MSWWLARLRNLWSFSLYPEAAEGGGSLSARRQVVPSGRPPNVKRAREEAARRARAKIRRYGAANRLNRLGTLTYRGEGCHDPLRLRADLAGFFRELRAGLGARAFPYLWVPEWHPGGHGLHAHFAVGRFVPRRLIERCWGTGFVHIKLLDGLPVGSGALAEARLAARYLAGYVGARSRGRAPAGGPAPLRGRAGLPAGEGPLLRRLGRGRDRARLRPHGLGAGAGLVVVGGGGLARSACLLVCLGWMRSCGLRRRPGPRSRRSRRVCRRRVEDHDVLRDVAALLGLKGSVAPDGGQARGVEAVEAAPAGADDDVVE